MPKRLDSHEGTGEHVPFRDISGQGLAARRLIEDKILEAGGGSLFRAHIKSRSFSKGKCL